MPKKPADRPERDPMAGEVARLLRQLDPAASGRAAAAKPRPRPKLPEPPPLRTLPSPPGVWGRAVLVAVLATAMMTWPYRMCGLHLAAYFAGTAVLLVAGVWAAHAAWRRRMGLAHVLAIVLIFVGTALAAGQVLPRLVYAPVETTWGCSP